MEMEKKDDLLEVLPEKEPKKGKGVPEVKKPEEKRRREETQPFYKMLPRNKVEERLVIFKVFAYFLTPFIIGRKTSTSSMWLL